MILSSPIIEVRNLVKKYKGADFAAVNDLTLSIGTGYFYGLLGPNGAGKTTTISILCGLISPDQGSIQIAGSPYRKNNNMLKSIIGVVPQDIALYPSLNAIENLRIFGGIYGLKGRVLKKKVEQLITQFGLERFTKKKISTYSGGMKRRLNLIAGLLHEPKILFLDEPTVGIDVQSKKVILENLQEINRKGTTLLYSSHQMEEAENICTRIAIIDHGKIIEEDSPKRFIEKYSSCSTMEDVYIHLTGKQLRD